MHIRRPFPPFLFLLILLILFGFHNTIAAQDDLLAPAEIPGEAIYIPFPVQINIDGDLADWAGVPVSTVTQGTLLSDDPAENGSFTVAAAADADNIYIAMTMPDKNIITGQHGADTWNEDSLEFFLNLTEDIDSRTYDHGIFQIRLIPADINNTDPNGLTIDGIFSEEATVTGYVFATDDGWGLETAVPISDFITPSHGAQIGFQAQANGATTTDRDVKLIWSNADTIDSSWQNPSLFGTGIFFEVGQSDIPLPAPRNVGAQEPEQETATTADTLQPSINSNQVGYYPDAPKRAALHLDNPDPVTWRLLVNEEEKLSGESIVIGEDANSGDFVHQIDFSEFNQPGTEYVLQVDALSSTPFAIDPDIYTQMRQDALRYFYLNRSGIELEPAYAGDWARPAGHLSDDDVTCFAGEDTTGKSWSGCDYTLDVAGGWYDAGDYGKYVVNGGISLWTLLNQYERNPEAYADGMLNIPESSNGLPDILDEARWEMEFLLSMQVPAEAELGGMAHHKIHDLEWDGIPSLPVTEQDNDNENAVAGHGRYLYPPSTAATLNLAATAAQCARIWAPIDTNFAIDCLNAAEQAWQAARENPAIFAGQVPGTGGGDYPDQTVSDEFYWAAAELFITTGKADYLDFVLSSPHFKQIPSGVGAMWWGDTATLGNISLAMLPNSLSSEDGEALRATIIQRAEDYLATIEKEAYLMPISEFEWGSNSAVLNNMIILGLAYEFSDDVRFLNGMTESMDYLLGRNPLSKSYVSGYGERPLQNPHHRFWANDPANGWPSPPPGVVAGGPNANPDDPTATQVGLFDVAPAKRYIDDIGTWTTNEITINWNAPLAWVTAFMDDYKQDVALFQPVIGNDAEVVDEETAVVENGTPAAEPPATNEAVETDGISETTTHEPEAVTSQTAANAQMLGILMVALFTLVAGVVIWLFLK